MEFCFEFVEKPLHKPGVNRGGEIINSPEEMTRRKRLGM